MPHSLKYRIVNYSLAAFFFGGIVLTYLEIFIYRETLVSWAIPAGIWLVTGALAAPLTSRYLNTYFKTPYFFLQLLYTIVAFGGLAVYLFMVSNYYLPASKELRLVKAAILKTGHLAKGENSSCSSPYAEVMVNGLSKELIFPCGLSLDNYKQVDLTLREGFWGFDIIEHKTLLIE